MAHYAFLNDENMVVQVITGKDEDTKPNGFDSWEDYYANLIGLRCVRTSFNTYMNQHNDGGVPFRGNFANYGHTYDEVRDVFIPPKPGENWVLNEETFSWEPVGA